MSDAPAEHLDPESPEYQAVLRRGMVDVPRASPASLTGSPVEIEGRAGVITKEAQNGRLRVKYDEGGAEWVDRATVHGDEEQDA